MPKSFQSTMKTRLSRPSPHAMFLTSCAEPGVSPPSPSNTNTLTSLAPASFRLSASPAAGGMPCPEGPVLNFRNSVRPSISACPGRPPRRRSFSSHSQVSAQRPSSGNANSASPVRSVPGPHRLVEHGERRVDQRHRVPRGQHEPVAEPAPRPQHVPAHRAGQQQRQHHVHLGPRPARVPALPVVERQVDALVDEVLDHLVAGEVGLGRREQPPDVELAARARDRR